MHNDDKRGSIKHLKRYKQLISYEGMNLPVFEPRNITPTDIDGFIDYNGVSFVYIEGKLEGKDVEYGQRLALQHVIDSHGRANNPSIAILFTHNEPPENLIDAKSQIVKEYYCSNATGWAYPKDGKITLLDAISKWEDYCTAKDFIL